MNSYLFLKSIHLIAVISWMAGLLYLPRIFVYHSQNKKNNEPGETFKIMEKKLYFYIMNPAMIVSWIFGFLLIHSIGINTLTEFWMITKIILVISLTLYHFFLFSCFFAIFSKGIESSVSTPFPDRSYGFLYWVENVFGWNEVYG